MLSNFSENIHRIKNTHATVIVVSISIAMGILIGRALATPLSSLLRGAPMLSLSVTSVNFGKLPVGERVTKLATLRNAGNRNLVIKEVSGSCGCTDVSIDKKVLGKGEETNLRITLTGRPESTSARVLITSNDPGEPQKFIYLESEAPMPVTLIPSRIEFSDINAPTLPISKSIIVKFSDIGMFTKSEYPTVLSESKCFKFDIKRNQELYNYEIIVTLLGGTPCGTSSHNLKISDPLGNYSVSTGIETDITSKFWHRLSPIVIRPDGKENGAVSLAKLKHKTSAGHFDITMIGYSDSIKGKVVANVLKQTESETELSIAFTEKHHESEYRNDGYIAIKAKDKPFSGYEESFIIPVNLLPSAPHAKSQ